MQLLEDLAEGEKGRGQNISKIWLPINEAAKLIILFLFLGSNDNYVTFSKL